MSEDYEAELIIAALKGRKREFILERKIVSRMEGYSPAQLEQPSQEHIDAWELQAKATYDGYQQWLKENKQ